MHQRKHTHHSLLDRKTKLLVLFIIGGLICLLIELLWRGHTHWSMGIVGGICFLICGSLNEKFLRSTKFWKQVLIGDCAIVIVEFCNGVLLNLVLKWNIWDYSHMPLNLLGQICLPFALLWLPIAAFAIFMDDFLRHYLYGEPWPHYVWL